MSEASPSRQTNLHEVWTAVELGMLAERLRARGLPPVPRDLLDRLNVLDHEVQWQCVRAIANDPRLQHVERLELRLRRVEEALQAMPDESDAESTMHFPPPASEDVWLGPLPSWSEQLIEQMQILNARLMGQGHQPIGERTLMQMSVLRPRDQYMCIWRVNAHPAPVNWFRRLNAMVHHFVQLKVREVPIPETDDENFYDLTVVVSSSSSSAGVE